MRKASAITLYIAAGFFIYTICLLAFVSQTLANKWGIIAGFSLPALVFLCVGLAVSRFHKWKRDVGVVLLSGAGLATFITLTFVCALTSDEFKAMLQPDTLQFFSAYTSGTLSILTTAAVGIILLKAGK